MLLLLRLRLCPAYPARSRLFTDPVHILVFSTGRLELGFELAIRFAQLSA